MMAVSLRITMLTRMYEESYVYESHFSNSDSEFLGITVHSDGEFGNYYLLEI